MTIIEQIKAEIERRIKILREDDIVRQNCSTDFLEGKIYGYEEVISFLSALESEKPMDGLEDVDFDREITHIWGKCAAEPNDQIACLHIESFIEIARHFAKWGAEHLKK